MLRIWRLIPRDSNKSEFLGVKTYTRSSRNRYEIDYSGLGSLATKNTCLHTRLAPAGCKWRYTHKNDYKWFDKTVHNPTEWPYKWVTRFVILLLSGFVTQFEIRRGPPCRLQYVPVKCFLRYTITPSSEQKIPETKSRVLKEIPSISIL